MKKRKTYVRSIDAIFGQADAYNEIPDLIDTGWLEKRGDRLAFGPACGDVLGLSIERETISWAVLGPRGPIASGDLKVGAFPIGGPFASREELEAIVVEALGQAASELPDRALAAVGVAWPRPIALDGEPYDDSFGTFDYGEAGEPPSPREAVEGALSVAGIGVDRDGDGDPFIEIVNDADADLLYDARLGVGRGVHDLLGLKICGGIGLSLIHRGHLVRGHGGRAGEIEHIKIRYEDFPLSEKWDNVRDLADLEPCSCNGANCIARFATGKTIVDQLRDYDDFGASYNERGHKVEEDQLRDVVSSVFGRAGRLLAQALLGPVLAFDPERVVISAFPRNPSLLQWLKSSLTDGTRVNLDAEDIVFASAKPERTAAGAGWVAVEQEVIPRIEEAVVGGSQRLRRYDLPYWLRSQVSPDEPSVGGSGPRYAPEKRRGLIRG